MTGIQVSGLFVDMFCSNCADRSFNKMTCTNPGLPSPYNFMIGKITNWNVV